METTRRSLTLPEPVPPLTVLRTPRPYSATAACSFSGRTPSFFNRTIPSAAAARQRRWFSISRAEGSGSVVAV